MKHLAITFVVVIFAAPACAQQDLGNITLKTTKVKDGVYMLEGVGGFAGGNVGLSVGEDGVFLIDDQLRPMSDKLSAAIAAITDQAVEFLLNTHYHGDHTGGNEAFGVSGAYIIAQDNVRNRLLQAKDKSPADALPIITFSDAVTFHWNGQDIHIVHPKHAHTDGDAVVFFENLNVLHTGDILFSGLYPFIDVDGGGSLDGYIGALESTAALIDDDTKVIPGHGPLSTKADLIAELNMLKDVRARIQRLIDDGMTEEAVIAAKPLADLDKKWAWDFIAGDTMAQIAYRSLATK